MNIVDKIKVNTLKFSKKQVLISEYMIHNLGNVPFMSLNELSKELQVSEVTILNFCKVIEVDSFTELKKEFQSLIKERLRIPEKMKSSLDELESTKDAYSNALQIQKMNFEQLAESNDIAVFENASQCIREARNVYLCGMGISQFVSQYLLERFRSIGINAVFMNLQDFGLYGHDLVKATDEDVFMLIAFPDYSIETVKLHTYLKHNNLRFIAVTDHEESPISKGAEVLLKAENNSLVFYNFLSNTFALLEVLLTVLGYTLKDVLIPELKTIMSTQEFFSQTKKE